MVNEMYECCLITSDVEVKTEKSGPLGLPLLAEKEKGRKEETEVNPGRKERGRRLEGRGKGGRGEETRDGGKVQGSEGGRNRETKKGPGEIKRRSPVDDEETSLKKTSV